MLKKIENKLTSLMAQHPRLFSIAIALAFGIATITGMIAVESHTVAYSITHSMSSDLG